MSDHIGKEGVLYKTYKERLGSSKPTTMHFNLSRIIRRIPSLDELSVPFSKEEIDAVIKEMPVDRALMVLTVAFLRVAGRLLKRIFTGCVRISMRATLISPALAMDILP